MRKIGYYLVIIAFSICLVITGCDKKTKQVIDYSNAETFEAALNAGENLEGKIVRFVAKDFKPDSAFGYNVIAGEHLNFVSANHPNIKIGDEVTVKCLSIQSFMKSWIIQYERVDAVESSSPAKTTTTTGKTTNLTTSSQKQVLDYSDAASFETALNSGVNTEGKTVKIVAKDFIPDSAFGYNVVAGEHLNFVSSKHPNIKVGDEVVVRCLSVESVMKSWIIQYELVDRVEVTTHNSEPTTEKESQISINTENTTHSSTPAKESVYSVKSGLWTIEVPSYWVKSNDFESFLAYAETGGKVAMLTFESEYDESDPVGFYWLDTENERNEVINSLYAGMMSSGTVKNCKLIKTEIIETEEYQGVLWVSEFESYDLQSTMLSFMFPSEEDNHWVSLQCSFSNNAGEHSYEEEFRKILSTIKKTS